MAERYAPISETGLGYDIFAPLWAVTELGAVTESGTPSLRDTSLGHFVITHRAEIDHVLDTVRTIGDFSAETMDIFEKQGGWHENRAVTPEYLLMYSGCIEAYPPDIEDPVVLRRLVATGADLQLTTLLHALVGAATVRGPGAGTAPALIADVVCRAGALLGADRERAVAETFRMWRVAFLPAILRPDSASPEEARVNYRIYAHALERLVAG